MKEERIDMTPKAAERMKNMVCYASVKAGTKDDGVRQWAVLRFPFAYGAPDFIEDLKKWGKQ